MILTFPLFLILAAGLPAQPPAPKPAENKPPAVEARPGDKVADIDVGKMLAHGSQASQGVPPETVVASIDGRKFTAAELERFINALPPQIQQNFNRDRKEFVRQWALLMHLSNMAQQEKLDSQSPTKERLEYTRMQVMVQAKMDAAARTVSIPPEELKKAYDDNKDKYNQVKIKVIYIPFVADPGKQSAPGAKKMLPEAEAKAKAEDLVKQIRGGADFVKLVKEHSEDAASAAKDGDFGTLHKSDTLPDAIKNAVFALKAGEVSDPVRQANGFYIFRAEEAGIQPYDQVKDNIFKELQQKKFQQWFEETRKGVDVKFENDVYFSTPPAPAGAPAGGLVTPVPPAPAQPKPAAPAKK